MQPATALRDQSAPSVEAFEEAARTCKMVVNSSRYNGAGGFYDAKTRTLILFDNQPKSAFGCMRAWAKANAITVVISRH